MICIRCGGTGLTFQNEKCDCGAKEESKILPKDLFIPKLYQTVEQLGENIVVRNITTLTIEDVVNRYVEEPRKHPSMALDISNTDLGGYQVYYYILGKLIDKYGEIPYSLQQFIVVNKISDGNLNQLEISTQQGEWKPLLFITDYPINTDDYKGKAKFLPFKGYNTINAYPLNLYIVRFINEP